MQSFVSVIVCAFVIISIFFVKSIKWYKEVNAFIHMNPPVVFTSQNFRISSEMLWHDSALLDCPCWTRLVLYRITDSGKGEIGAPKAVYRHRFGRGLSSAR